VSEIDPEATLDELVQLGYQLADSRNKEQAEALLAEIIEKATDLREWISRGGFTPTTKGNGTNGS
jgi:hypothetical protein